MNTEHNAITEYANYLSKRSHLLSRNNRELMFGDNGIITKCVLKGSATDKQMELIADIVNRVKNAVHFITANGTKVITLGNYTLYKVPISERFVAAYVVRHDEVIYMRLARRGSIDGEKYVISDVTNVMRALALAEEIVVAEQEAKFDAMQDPDPNGDYVEPPLEEETKQQKGDDDDLDKIPF